MNSTLINKPDIIIVDDHRIFRQGLKFIIENKNIATIIGEASNGKALLELLSKLKPNLVLMDIDMPIMNGKIATQMALEMVPDLKIIAITMYGDLESFNKMIILGAKGFVEKTSGIEDLEKAIDAVMAGESYFSSELLLKIINKYGQGKALPIAITKAITARELEILQLICHGFSTDLISQKLNISSKTVGCHRSNLFKKTMTKNTSGLILYAVKNKIITI